MRHVSHLNDTVFCKIAPSMIGGVGVFAIRDMLKGTPITDYDNRKELGDHLYQVLEDEFMQIRPEVRELILDRMTFEEGRPLTFVSPNANQSLQAFMNHSDDANTDGHVTLHRIHAGEELTEDYRKLARTLHPLSKEHMPFL